MNNQHDTNQRTAADQTPPSRILPKGACDSHCHVFGPFSRFPPPEDRSFMPPEAPETALRDLHRQLGFDRAVIVQSQGHGYDHRPLLEALAVGRGRYRGVALLRPDPPRNLLQQWHDAGIRGIRFSFMPHLGGMPDLDVIRGTIGAIRDFDWHVAIHVAGRGVLDVDAFLRSLDVRIVIDHMARPDIADPDVISVRDTLQRLIDTGRVWVKVSGVDRLSKTGAPFDDAVPFAAAIINHNPDRVLWGSDWPHVNLHGPKPSDRDLVDFIARHTTQAQLCALLVDNPREFFGFDDRDDDAQASV
jgi:predicted TIM-barrel fold metal-dependent hydrolase